MFEKMLLGDRLPLSTFVAVFLLILLMIYFKTWLRCSWLVLKLKGPTALPIVGNALIIADSARMEYLANVCHTLFGRIFRIWVSVIPAVMVLEPKDVQTIIGSSKHNDKNFLYALMHNFIGEGLISNNGDKWKIHRKLIQPHFHINILELYVNSFCKSSSRQVRKLKNVKDINVNTYVNDCVLDILHETILGIPLEDAETKEKSPFRKGAITLPIRIQKPWYLFDYLYKFTTIAQDELSQKTKLHDYTRKMIELNKSIKNDSNHSLLRIFLDISENNPQFTEDDVVNEICTFMLAGQDSVAAAVAFSLHCLAYNQEAQAKVCQELDEIFNGSDRCADASDLRKMRYLEQCIKETLRLYPSVPIIARKLSEDVTIDKYTLPEGCNVFICPYATHRLAHIYENPKKFDPDRFSPENLEKLHPFAFIPFSAGPRNCIGYKFAYLEMKVILSSILRSYKIFPSHTKFSILYRITLRAKGGIWVRFEPREAIKNNNNN
nr:probable cytochrome P450 4aa1 [Onthophagus taurus]